MNVTCEVTEYSTPAKANVRIHNAWGNGHRVEIEINGERYTFDGAELISAIRRCVLIRYD